MKEKPYFQKQLDDLSDYKDRLKLMIEMKVPSFLITLETGKEILQELDKYKAKEKELRKDIENIMNVSSKFISVARVLDILDKE